MKKIENYINGKSAEAGVVIQDLKSIKSDGTEGEVIGKKISDGIRSLFAWREDFSAMALATRLFIVTVTIQLAMRMLTWFSHRAHIE